MALHTQTQLQELLSKNRIKFPVDTKLYAVIRHVSASGLQRTISFYTMHNGEMCRVDGIIGDVLGYKHSKKHTGLIVRGCGMDMAYHVVSSFSQEIHPELHGYSLKLTTL